MDDAYAPESLDTAEQVSSPLPAPAAEYLFGPAQGAPGAPCQIEIVRTLTPTDVEAIVAAAGPGGNAPAKLPGPAQGPTLQSLRHAHHHLAQVLAQGASLADAALRTGYSIAYISNLKNSPAFAELLAHYAGVREEIFVDALKRLKALGISAMEELQERLALDPAGFSKREIMDLIKLSLVDAPGPRSGAPGAPGGSALAVNVTFVSSRGEAPKAEIELESRRIEP